MGKHWDDFKDRLATKSVGVGMIITDLVFLIVLAACMIAADLGREWLFQHIGVGNLFTHATLIIVEVLLDLSAIAVIGGWLLEDIKRLFQ